MKQFLIFSILLIGLYQFSWTNLPRNLEFYQDYLEDFESLEVPEGMETSPTNPLFSDAGNILERIKSLLEEHQNVKLQAQNFVYPFGINRKLMKPDLLIPSAKQENKWTDVKVIKTASSGTDLAASQMPIRTNFSVLHKQEEMHRSDSLGQIRSKQNQGTHKKTKLPSFLINGVLNSKSEQMLIIGNRSYRSGEKLRGSKELRRVKVLGFDGRLAYFHYQGAPFARKVKALERVF